MITVLSSLVVHTKRMRTCVFRLKTDPILLSNYSSVLMKRLLIESCSMLIMQSKSQNTAVLLAVASPDTDAFVCVIHHFNQLMFFDLNEFWFISGQSDSTTAVPIQSLVDHINADVVDILPSVHALTECDTTSKVGTKPAALKTANKCGYELLLFFARLN